MKNKIINWFAGLSRPAMLRLVNTVGMLVIISNVALASLYYQTLIALWSHTSGWVAIGLVLLVATSFEKLLGNVTSVLKHLAEARESL